MKRIVPINTDSDGNCRTIKADYYKMALTNFMRGIWCGKKDGFIATGVVEYEDSETESSE